MSVIDHKCRIQFERMEKQKQEVIGLIRPLSEGKYMEQPATNSWSAAQVANHLFLSEKLSLAYLRKKMTYPDTIPPYHFKSWMGVLYLKLVFGPFVKAKSPAAINMWKEQEILNPDDLDQQWTRLRKEMVIYFEETYPRFKNFLVYNHPFAGRLTMRQMLIFFNGHIAHHIRQLKRAIKLVG